MALLIFLPEEISARKRSMSVIMQFEKQKNDSISETRSPKLPSQSNRASACQLLVNVKKVFIL